MNTSVNICDEKLVFLDKIYNKVFDIKKDNHLSSKEYYTLKGLVDKDMEYIKANTFLIAPLQNFLNIKKEMPELVYDMNTENYTKALASAMIADKEYSDAFHERSLKWERLLDDYGILIEIAAIFCACALTVCVIHFAVYNLGGFIAAWIGGFLFGALLASIPEVGKLILNKYGFQDYIIPENGVSFISEDEINQAMQLLL